jgi:hypothetical protein
MAYYDNRVLLNNSAVDNGTWVEATQWNVPFSITLQGFAAGDSAEVRVSNLVGTAPPANTVHEILYGTAFTADGKQEVTAPYRWVKVRKAAAGGVPATTLAQVHAQIVHG